MIINANEVKTKVFQYLLQLLEKFDELIINVREKSICCFRYRRYKELRANELDLHTCNYFKYI